MVNQVFLNIFVAIIVDAFTSQTKALDCPVQPIDVETFAEAWKDLDPSAKGQIQAEKLMDLVDKLVEKKSQLLPPGLTQPKVTRKETAVFLKNEYKDL